MTSFNTVLLEFLEQLGEQFPESAALRRYKTIAKPLIQAQPSLPAAKFTETAGPHFTKILQRDPAFFEECPSILQGVDMAKLWKSPGLTDESRDIIWQYLTSLYYLSLTTLLPANTMDQIQTMATQLEGMFNQGQLDPKLLRMFAPPEK